MAQLEAPSLENGKFKFSSSSSSSSSCTSRKRHDNPPKTSCNGVFKMVLGNLQEVVLGTKLAILIPAIPLAVAADYLNFGRPWLFTLSLLGLAPLAERVSYLTEQIANYTSPTVGGLLNATCGNATELIIALIALKQEKIEVVKCSLLGSILSNLLLVLGTSLVSGGLANLDKEQKFDRKQADVNSGLMLLALLCQMVPLMIKYTAINTSAATISEGVLQLSRAGSIIMLLCYLVYLIFQLKTHRQYFGSEQEQDESDVSGEDSPVGISFCSALAWLVVFTIAIALLSDYIVGTIEVVSQSWGLSVSFISVILLPIVGNASEHTSAVIFAIKNKLDISLGVALGSATQIATFVIPLTVIVAWITGIAMDLSYSILETGSLFLAVLLTAFTLQDGSSHYLKGLILVFCYIVIGSSFYLTRTPLHQSKAVLRIDGSSPRWAMTT